MIMFYDSYKQKTYTVEVQQYQNEAAMCRMFDPEDGHEAFTDRWVPLSALVFENYEDPQPHGYVCQD